MERCALRLHRVAAKGSIFVGCLATALMSSQMAFCRSNSAVEATDGEDASVICVKGHVCHAHHFGEERNSLYFICKECLERLSGAHGFRCSACNYNVCDFCSAAVRQLMFFLRVATWVCSRRDR